MISTKILVWAGPLDIFAVVDVPEHGSVAACLNGLKVELFDMFGPGATMVKVHDNKYVVNVDKVVVEKY